MPYRDIWIWVEGSSDERFLNNTIIKKRLRKLYNNIIIREIKWKKKEKTMGMIDSFKSMDYIDFIFITDIDDAKCVTDRKEKFKKVYKNLNDANIIIVIKEIESWYVAGLGENDCKKIGIPNYSHTNDLVKEEVENFFKKKKMSKIDCLEEILKYFSIEIAVTKNVSFKYFAYKYSLV